MDKVKKAIYALALAAIVFTSFYPSLNNGFTNWDDDQLIVKNAAIRELSGRSLKTIFGSYNVSTYIPFTMLSFALDYRLWGLDARGYHAENLAWHILNCILVYLIFMLLGMDPLIAFIGALLWGVHPLRVESVAWATERKDVLFAFFYLGAVLSYLKWTGTDKRLWLVTSWLLFLVSCLSKGVAVTLPVVLLALDRFKGLPFDLRSIKLKAPYFVMAVIFGSIAFMAQSQGTVAGANYAMGLAGRFCLASRNLVFYLYKTLWPIGLSAFYPYPAMPGGRLPLLYYLSPVLILAAAWCCIILRRKAKGVFWGAVIFVVTIFPVLQFVRLRGESLAADRYTYLPAIGFSLAVSSAMARFLGGRQSGLRAKAAVAAAVFLTAVSCILVWKRTKVWTDSLSLWNDVIEKHPAAAMAYNKRGQAYREDKKFYLALKDYEKALDIQPGFGLALGNRGLLYAGLGRYDLAIKDFSAIVAADRNDFTTFNNRGSSYLGNGDFLRAAEDFSAAILINNTYFDAYYNRAWAYRAAFEAGTDRKYLAMALSDLDKAIDIDPKSAKALNLRGAVKGALGDAVGALADLNNAVKNEPFFAEAYNNLAILFYLQGKYDRAWDNICKAKALGYAVNNALEANIVKRLDGR